MDIHYDTNGYISYRLSTKISVTKCKVHYKTIKTNCYNIGPVCQQLQKLLQYLNLQLYSLHHQ